MNICQAVAERGSEIPVQQSETMVPARRSFCHRDEIEDWVPFVCDGWAARYQVLPDGGRQILSFALPGELLSSSLVFEGRTQGAVEAVTEVRCRRFKRSDLLELLLGAPDMLQVIVDVCLTEKTRADRLIADLGRKPADGRIAALLGDLIGRLREAGMVVSDKRIEFPLRQHHIADATGLTAVHVSKVLSELRRKQIVALEGRFLSVLDPPALDRLAGGSA